MKKFILLVLFAVMGLFGNTITLNGYNFYVDNGTDLLVCTVNDVQQPIVYREYLGEPEAGLKKTIICEIGGSTYQIETSCSDPDWQINDVDEIRK